MFSFLSQCWEDKLRKQLTSTYLDNQASAMPNGYTKTQAGSAAAAAVNI